MSALKRKAFIRAYLGEAQGNATEAAKRAGYSERTAHSQGSRLLKHVEVAGALQKRVEKLDVSTDAALQNVARIAHKAPPADAETRDILKANELLLKVSGALTERRQTDSRITVNIGFLSNSQPSASVTTIDISDDATTHAEHAPPAARQVLPGISG